MSDVYLPQQPQNIEVQYLDLLMGTMECGNIRDGRNGKTLSLFGEIIRHDMSLGFPLLTTKYMPFHLILSELLWFISGSTDTRILNDLDCKIWNANANAGYWLERGYAKFEGDAGRVYGAQWRGWARPNGSHVDQLAKVIKMIKETPSDRRLVVQAFNPGELDQMCLPPCHMGFQFYSANGELSLMMFQRSCDMFLGVPFNIASYALLLCFVAQIVGQTPKELKIVLGDFHIYANHMDAVKEQLSRKTHPLPKLVINKNIKALKDLELGKKGGVPIDTDAVKRVAWLEGSTHEPAIRAEMAV